MDFPEYAEMFRSYFPNMNTPAIRECYQHHATPSEYRTYLERIGAPSAKGGDAVGGENE